MKYFTIQLFCLFYNYLRKNTKLLSTVHRRVKYLIPFHSMMFGDIRESINLSKYLQSNLSASPSFSEELIKKTRSKPIRDVGQGKFPAAMIPIKGKEFINGRG